MTVDVMVLVLLPMRTESAMDSGTVLPISPVPSVARQSPLSRDLMSTIAPGITLAFITLSISVWSAAA